MSRQVGVNFKRGDLEARHEQQQQVLLSRGEQTFRLTGPELDGLLHWCMVEGLLPVLMAEIRGLIQATSPGKR